MNEGVKVLSLFDGMCCGMLALNRAGIPVSRYVSYEVDKYAIKTASHNFPMIEQMGDVFQGDFTRYEGFDYLMGGSPCTYWSIAKSNGRETTASGVGWELFQQYVRALKEAKPKFFIYENNKSMSKDIKTSICDSFGFEPILINSALVSAQTRQRLYWVGQRNEDGTYSKVDISQPKDQGILLKNILESNAIAFREKARTMTSSVGRTTTREAFYKQQNTMVAEPVNITSKGKSQVLKANYHKMSNANFFNGDKGMNYAATGVAEPVNITPDGKSQTLKAQYAKNSIANFIEYTSTYGATGVAEPVCVAQRGRESDGGTKNTEQKYEARTDSKSNALTTAYKNNMVAQPVRIGTLPTKSGAITQSLAKRVYSIDSKSVSLKANGGGEGANTGLYAIPIEEIQRSNGLLR